jgi:hypothetical protein
MSNPMFPALYSPLNFAVGAQMWLVSRVAMSADVAAAEVERLHPRWQYRIMAVALTVVLLLLTLGMTLPSVAPSAVAAIAPAISGKQAAGAIALAIGMAFIALAWGVLRRGVLGYVYFCRLGYAERTRRRSTYTE